MVIERKVKIQSVLNLSKVLDVTGARTTDGTQVILWDDHGGLNQQWWLARLGTVPDGSIIYEFISCLTTKALTIAHGPTTRQGEHMVIQTEAVLPHQQWQVREHASGTMHIISQNSALALDIRGASDTNGTQIIQWPLHGGRNQQWNLVILE